MDLPRSEYPRPQFRRQDWLCLNGEWQFEIDHGDSGLERGMRNRELADRITVPFCPESGRSGIGNTDFLTAVWYRREVRIPEAWAGRRVLLHFQAVDYETTVWVNDHEVGRHKGGFTPFTCEVPAEAGTSATIVVRARDDHRQHQPKGKQCHEYDNRGCLYTRTTGIWQTVWMEPVPESRLERPRMTPDVGNGEFVVETPLTGTTAGLRVRASVNDERGEIATQEVAANADFTPRITLAIPAERRRLWEPGNGYLYDITIELCDAKGEVIDRAESYAGLRGVTIEGKRILINGKAVFQRLVLDQGYYPDGILTAPSDEALVADIQLSLDAGFNGARLHQKVFEERFLYHADRMGYLVWGEFPDWHSAADGYRDRPQWPATFATQWLEVLQRDRSHPSIVGWCPLNETHEAWGNRITDHDDIMLALSLICESADGTRPVLDTSGYSHRVPGADVWDTHDYCQDVEQFKKNQAGLANGQPHQVNNQNTQSVSYRGQPFFVSEFGGIWWNPEAAEGEDSWGYGERPQTIEAFYERFEGLCAGLLDDPNMFGYCYTQLTDVFQEQNGIYTFDRAGKFDMRRIRAAQQKPAAIEAG